MSKNFIVIFWEREGSSAIIEYFSVHPNVNVPLFEGMDWYLRKDIPIEKIHIVLDRLFFYRNMRSATKGWAQDDLAVIPRQIEKLGVIGFKWRIWGNPQNVAKALKKYDVTVYHLIRADLLNFGMSAYLNDVYVPETGLLEKLGIKDVSHTQFTSVNYSPDVAAKVRAAIQSGHPIVDIAKFVEIVRRYAETKLAIERQYMKLFREMGLRTALLRYEDFNADPVRFYKDLCADIGIGFYENTKTELKKIGKNRPIEQAKNRDDVLADQALLAILREYQAVFGHA